MSFILDALKRADQERRQEPLTVTFDSGTEEYSETPAPRNLGPILGVTVVLLLALAMAGYFGLKAWQGSGSPVESSPTQNRIEAAAPSPLETRTPEIRVPESAETSALERPNLQRQGNSKQQPSAPLTDSKPSKAVQEIDSLYASEQKSESTDLAVEQLYSQPEPEPSIAPVEATRPPQSLPAEPVTQVQAPSPVEPEPDLPAMAQIRDLPWSLQQKIPSISYSRHSYNEGGLSSVVINGQQRRAGQQLEANLRLEEILADGVVLSFEGRRFKLPALSSWVNM